MLGVWVADCSSGAAPSLYPMQIARAPAPAPAQTAASPPHRHNDHVAICLGGVREGDSRVEEVHMDIDVEGNVAGGAVA